MKQDRFLTGILIGIGVLVVVALTVFFTRKDSQTYIAEDTPEGVVHNYVVAVLNKDYERAYNYLAERKYKPTFTQFRQSFLNGNVYSENSAIDVGASEIAGDEAWVEVATIYNPSDPFSTGYRNTQRATLVKQDGAWKISLLPVYSFWDYSWYSEPPKP